MREKDWPKTAPKKAVRLLDNAVIRFGFIDCVGGASMVFSRKLLVEEMGLEDEFELIEEATQRMKEHAQAMYDMNPMIAWVKLRMEYSDGSDEDFPLIEREPEHWAIDALRRIADGRVYGAYRQYAQKKLDEHKDE